MQRHSATESTRRKKAPKKATKRVESTQRERDIADAIEATRMSTRRDSSPPRSTTDLRELSESPHASDDPRAFLDVPNSDDMLAEQLGEDFVSSATTGEYVDRSDEVSEERGGPFVVTPAIVELAFEYDESNPEDATREPFPKT